MQVTFLGTADGHTSPQGRNHSGILIQADGFSLLLDCGAPVAQYLLGRKIDPDVPEAIWLRHVHSDHIGQFPSLIQSLWLRARRAPLHVYAPEPVVPMLRDYLAKCLLFPELIGFPIVWHALSAEAKATKHHAFVLKAFPTAHLDNLASFFKKNYPETCFECYGLILDTPEGRYVYSADIALPRELRPALKKPVKALFCELTHFPEAALFEELAGKQVDSLWVTHYPDHFMKQEAALRKLAKKEGFRGKVFVMADKQSCVL